MTRRFISRVFCGLACLGTFSGGASAQIVRSMVRIAGQEYLGVQQRMHDLPGLDWQTFLSDHRGSCLAVLVNDGRLDLYVQGFDAWARPSFGPVGVGAIFNNGAEATHGARSDNRIWTAWDVYLPTAIQYARAFDTVGVLIGPPIVVDERLSSWGWIRLAVDSARAVVAYGDGNGDNVDLFARVYDVDGKRPLSHRIAVADPLRREMLNTVIMQTDGSILLGYVRSALNPVVNARPVLQRINPDYSLGPAYVVAAVNVNRFVARAQSNGSVLVVYRREPLGTGGGAVRCDASGQPLMQPVDLPDWHYAAIAPDGRLALARQHQDPGHVTFEVMLFDANIQPLTDWFDPVLQPAPPDRNILVADQAIAYGEDGALWMVWYPYSGWAPPYLTMLRPFEPGDLNADGVVNNFDIDPFVLALTDPETCQQQFPGVPYEFIGDVNFDGRFDNFDIDPFVELLWGP